jgi:energy-coupling factor transporter ATP-binding protein EcfA2
MTYPSYFNSKKSLDLFGLFKDFNFLKDLYLKNKLPKVLMLSGNKGSGKSTLLNHLIHYIFDKDNYDEEKKKFDDETVFHKQFVKDIHPNIVYLDGSNLNNTKIENIRNLKKNISKTVIADKPRFIILDDVELFNNNSLNALLKTIEEPTSNNFFFLINNKSKPLIDTIKSRCLEIKLILNEEKRLNIIECLIKKFDTKVIIDPKIYQLTPGNFIKFNYIFDENKISLNNNFTINLNILLNLYKKDKTVMYMDMILFLADSYFINLKNKNFIKNEKIIEYKRFVFDNINKYFLYNLNQNVLLNTISNKINNE